MYNKGDGATGVNMADFTQEFSRFANRAIQVRTVFDLHEDGSFVFARNASGTEQRTSHHCFAPEDPLVADIITAAHASGAHLRVIFADAKGNENKLQGIVAGQYVMTVRESAQGGWVIDPHLKRAR